VRFRTIAMARYRAHPVGAPLFLDEDSMATRLTVLTAFTLVLSACSSERRAPGFELDAGNDPSGFDCPIPEQVVSDVTCAITDQMCPGSCREGFAGVTAVGSIRCRCMDVGSGFGAQWICDTATCDADGGAMPDGGVGMPDAGPDPACPPLMATPPSAPGCTSSQLAEFRALMSQAEFDAFMAAPANAGCRSCLSAALLSCATARSCSQALGDFQCCLEAACGADMACRAAAVEGVCSGPADALVACVAAEDACTLDTEAPPAACFP
jgi:hypothetical protein